MNVHGDVPVSAMLTVVVAQALPVPDITEVGDGFIVKVAAVLIVGKREQAA